MKTEYPKIQICNNCNSLFAEYRYMVLCCNKCKREYFLNKKYKKKENHRQKEIFEAIPINEVFKPVKRNCIICDNDISHKRKDAKYCSQKCQAKAVSKEKELIRNMR